MDIYALVTQENLDRIARHCPRALHTYTSILGRARQDGTLFLSRDVITDDLSESYTLFVNNIKKLAIEGLLEWHRINDGIHITLVLPEIE